MKKHLFSFFFLFAFFLPLSGNAMEAISCDLDITTTNNSITVGNLDAPIVILKVFNPDFSLNYSCSNNCNNPTVITGLVEGETYYVSVNQYGSNWVSICAQNEYITLGGGTGCVDDDNDGICADSDCDDNDASLPATPGTSCDDGDANTSNDVIQADGCSCAGTPVTTSNCDINWTTDNNSITITGLTAPHVIFKLHNPNWSINTECFDNCTDPLTISGLTTGATYHLNYNLYDDNWLPICGEVVSVVIAGSGNNLPDLTLTNLQTDPTGNPGAVTNFTFDLNNIGNTTASGNYTIRAYLSANTLLDNNDTPVGEIITGNTSIGTIADVAGSITVPNLPDGDYFLILKADDNNNITESNENNNTVFANYQIFTNNEESCGFLKTYLYDAGQFISTFNVQEQIDEYVITGNSSVNFQTGEQRELIVTTDKNGELISVDDNIITVPPSPIQVTLDVNDDFDLVVTKTNAGNVEWTSTISFDLPPGNVIIGTNADQIRRVAGGYLIAGTVIPSFNGAPFNFITYSIKLDEDGNQVQQNLYDPQLIDDFFNLGAYFPVEGGSIFSVFGGGRLSFIKFDEKGAFQWLTPYTADLPSNTLVQLAISPDEQFVYAANINNQRAILDKVNTDTGEKVYKLNLNEVLSPNLVFPFSTQMAGFLLTDDGGVVLGIKYRDGVSSAADNIFDYGKLDENGEVIWKQSIELNFALRPYLQTSDGGFYWFGIDPTISPQESQEPIALKTTETGEITPTCGEDPDMGIELGCDLSYTTDGSNISITGNGLNAAHVIIKIFSPNWSTLLSCLDNCGSSVDLGALTPGTYHVSADLYDANWVKTCSLLEDVVIGGPINLQGNGQQETQDEEKLEAELKANSIILYPNPASHETLLSLAAYEGEDAMVVIYNSLGQAVKKLDIASCTKEPIHIATNNLPDGLYQVQIKTSDRKAVTKKLMIGKL